MGIQSLVPWRHKNRKQMLDPLDNKAPLSVNRIDKQAHTLAGPPSCTIPEQPTIHTPVRKTATTKNASSSIKLVY